MALSRNWKDRIASLCPLTMINRTLMARMHDVPLEDAQELHVSVVMIIVVVPTIVIAVGEGSVTGTAVRVGFLSIVPPPLFPCQGGQRRRHHPPPAIIVFEH